MIMKFNKKSQRAWILLATLVLFTAPMSAFGQVSLPNGTINESVVDLTVKTVAGPVSIDRQFEDGRWQINMRWNPAVVSGEPTGDSLCRAYPELRVQGRTYSGDGQTWLLENRYSVRTTDFFNGSDCAANRIKTIRWQDRNSGKWMEYSRTDPSELQFKLVKFGNRNDVTTTLVYDSQGRVKTVNDHFGTVIFQYFYTGELLTEIRDNPGIIAGSTLQSRSVKYEYSNTTNALGKNYDVISKVIDVVGNAVLYGVASGNISSITDAEGRTRRYEYTAGRVIKYVDPDGKITTYVYDYDKTKKEFYVRINYPSTLAGNKAVEQWYNSEGMIIRRDVNGKTEYQKTAADTSNRSDTQIDLAGRATVTTKDEFGNVTKIVYPDESQITASYSPLHGQVLEEIDELGVKTGYEYDDKGNLLRKIEALGFPEQRVTEYEYDSLGQLIKETRKGKPAAPGAAGQDVSVLYEYENRGNRIKMTDPLGNVTRYAYDIVGIVSQLTDASNNVWKAETDKSGRIVARINPLNHRIEAVYDKIGNRVKTIDALNNETRFVYDGFNRVRQSINALGGIRQTEYDEQGHNIAEINEAGQISGRSTYDAEGRLISSQDIAGNTTSYEYDSTVTSTAPVRVHYEGLTREMRYDARDRETEVVQIYSQTDANGIEKTVSVSSKSVYDKKGQVVEAIDRLGNKTLIAYDALGRVKSTTDANGGVTKFTYDARDNLLALTDPNGNTTQYEYDANNRRLKERRPMGETTAYSYDALGNLTEITDAKGNQIRYGYNVAGRRIKEQHFPVGSSTATRTIVFAYNAVGSMTAVTDTNKGHGDHLALSQTYTLDELQRKTQEQVTLGEQAVTTNTTYTVTGKKASQSLADGTMVTYQYDHSGGPDNKGTDYLQAIELPGAGSISINERTRNQPSQITYPGGGQRNIAYDALLRLGQIQVKSPGQQILMNYGYRFDVQSNVTAKQTEHGDYIYLYDNLQRLTQAIPEIYSGPGLPQEHYTYDRLGNRLTDSNQGGASPWQYNANNQLTQSYRDTAGAMGDAISQINLSYDDNGSIVRKSASEVADKLNNQKYIYDAANRLTEVQDASGNVIASYQYDPQSRRIRKTMYREDSGDAWVLLNTFQTTLYFYNDEGLIAEYVQNGGGQVAQSAATLQTQYGWEPDSTWGTNPLFIKTKRVDANGVQAETAEYFYYQNDHLGAPQQIIDSQGEVVWMQRSTAFGKAKVITAAITNNLRYPGQYFDAETGTHQNFFRDYDPVSGRYWQSDPLGVISDLALYAYAKNAPLNQYDQFGLCSFSIQYRQAWKRLDFQVITESEWDFSSPRYEWGAKPSKRPSTKKVPGKFCYAWTGSDVWHYMLKRRVDHEQLIEDIKVCETCEEECRSSSKCSDWMFNRIVNDRWVWWNVPWLESYYKGFEENPNPQEICLPLPPLRF